MNQTTLAVDEDVTGQRRRVLFFAEAATLAHVARPMVLASGLEKIGYDIHFACHPRYQSLFEPLQRPWIALNSISSEAFLDALAKGRPLYRAATLKNYVEEDLKIIDRVKPDLIVGDFRLSLSISARMSGIPYVTITNAYWSPYSRPSYQVPELPMTRILGFAIANKLFNFVRPLAFALHTRPLNSVRKYYNLPSLGFDLRRIYTEADITLYADLSELIPTFERPANHHYIGPINWSPSVPLPEWWQDLPDDKPVIYITPGSSGEAGILPDILHAISDLPVHGIVASGGRADLSKMTLPDNVHLTDFLPGETAVARAQLVICNGGSPTSMQALANGVPVLGIANNLDQYLNMGYMESHQAGRLMRTSAVNPLRIRQGIEALLDPKYRKNAEYFKSLIQSSDPISTVAAILKANGLQPIP